MIRESYDIGGKVVTAYIPDKTTAQNLESLYEVCNDLFNEYEDCFYSKEDFAKLKKDKRNTFINKKKRGI